MGNVLHRALGVLILVMTTVTVCAGCSAFEQATPHSASPLPSASSTPTVAAPGITEGVVDNLLLPAGSCGEGSPSIQLHNGSGETFDANKNGASITETKLVGTMVPTGATRSDAVVVVRCAAVPLADCCAGRLAEANGIVVLDINGTIITRVGNAMFASTVAVPNPTDDGSREFDTDNNSPRIDGGSIVAHEALVYGDLMTPSPAPGLEGWYRFTLQGDQWVESPL